MYAQYYRVNLQRFLVCKICVSKHLNDEAEKDYFAFPRSFLCWIAKKKHADERHEHAR